MKQGVTGNYKSGDDDGGFVVRGERERERAAKEEMREVMV